MVLDLIERESSWFLEFQLYFPITLYREVIVLSSALFDNNSISHLELLTNNKGVWACLEPMTVQLWP
jgi:hypothetical protein